MTTAMLYRVWGKFDSSKKQEFRRVLTDGTVEGGEHERATVYDRFFTGLETEGVEKPPALSGDPFWDYLSF